MVYAVLIRRTLSGQNPAAQNQAVRETAMAVKAAFNRAAILSPTTAQSAARIDGGA
jgi:hypothetical protein